MEKNMSAALENKVKVWEESVIIPTYQAGKPEKNPLFIEKRAYQGSSGKVYPLPVTEKISDEKADIAYRAIFLENEYLLVMILPELGGRIQRALDKTNGYDFVYYNHVIKPALVGLTGPWISGGIEFNWPQHHRPSTFLPINYSYKIGSDGSGTVYLGETDRMYGTQELTRITLYPQKAYIEIQGQVYNPTDFPQTFLWWANPAVPVNDDTYSVFPPDVNAVMDHGKRAVSSFPIATGEYYKYDYSAGVDISRYKNIKVPTSYMAAHSDYDFIGNYDGKKEAGLLHVADHHISPGKKQWTWGCGDFGKMWDRNLTDEDGPYIELMTGVYTDNQPDFTWLKPQEEKTFSQYFLPYKGVGRVGNATKDGVVNFSVEQDTLRIYAYVTSLQENCILRLTKGNCVLYEKQTTLSPLSGFTDSVEHFGEAPEGCTLQLSCNGRVLVSYTYYERKPLPIPEPAAAIPRPEEIKSTEDLYLSALHLEQYRHATFDPADYYKAGLQKDETDIRLNNAYGLLLMRQGNEQEALSHFLEAVKKITWKNPNPYWGDPYFNLGLAFAAANRKKDAFDAFYKSIWSLENQASGFYYLACISCRSQEYEKALEFTDSSLQRNNRSLNALTLKAALLRILKRTLEKRWEHLRCALPVNPLETGLLFEEALLDGNFETFRGVMRDDSHNYLSLALVYYRAGLWRDILTLLSAADLHYPMIYYFRGYAHAMADGQQPFHEHDARFNTLANKEQMLSCYQKGEQALSDYCFPNRPEERAVLEHVIENLEKAPMAHYYLGNLLYDKKQYDAAISHWEISAKTAGCFAMPFRNLAIAYYNKHGNRKKALKYMLTACQKSPDNMRFHLEYDQLAECAGISPAQRLKTVQSLDFTMLSSRDDLYLRYIHLLNCLGRCDEALPLLMEHRFHPWEGGEGKVSTQYRFALCQLARSMYEEGKNTSSADWAKQALLLLEQSLSYPNNLGEGKLPNARDNQAHYYMGIIYEAIGQKEDTVKYYKKALSGNSTPSLVLYYNDLPSDYIFYQGLAYSRLHQPEMAKGCFHRLKAYGERHIFDKIDYDYFAVSLPELDVFQTDLQLKNTIYCKYLTALGHLGLGNIQEAGQLFREILAVKPDHLQASLYNRILSLH
jgi:tetratricopeptide (TPR) repeat protein